MSSYDFAIFTCFLHPVVTGCFRCVHAYVISQINVVLQTKSHYFWLIHVCVHDAVKYIPDCQYHHPSPTLSYTATPSPSNVVQRRCLLPENKKKFLTRMHVGMDLEYGRIKSCLCFDSFGNARDNLEMSHTGLQWSRPCQQQ